MSKKANLPAAVPSLAAAFADERQTLRAVITSGNLSTAQAAIEARRALDRTGQKFLRASQDVHLQKAALWLIEMVKAGAGIVDQAAHGDIVWREVPRRPAKTLASGTLFYGAAASFMLAGFVQGSRLTIAAALVLVILRFFDPRDWGHITAKIPFLGRRAAPRLEAPETDFRAHIHINVAAGGFVDSLTDALKTADHILARLAEPAEQHHWRDNDQIISLLQNLLEAAGAGDTEFTGALLNTELPSVLAAGGIEIVHYSKKTSAHFDVLPALDLEGQTAREAAPALRHDGRIIRRGTIWQGGT